MRISFVQPLGSGISMPLKEKQISADFERILTLSFKQSRRHRERWQDSCSLSLLQQKVIIIFTSYPISFHCVSNLWCHLQWSQFKAAHVIRLSLYWPPSSSALLGCRSQHFFHRNYTLYPMIVVEWIMNNIDYSASFKSCGSAILMSCCRSSINA